MQTKGPLRRVARLVERYREKERERRDGSWYTERWTEHRELLECGHLFDPPYGLHGTTIGDRDRRRCPHCAAGKPADDVTEWGDM